MRVNIWTDGSTTRNPGPGAFAVLLILEDGRRQAFWGSIEQTTSQREELEAALCAIAQCSPNDEITLTTDSQYVSRGIREHLKRWVLNGYRNDAGGPVANQDLWSGIYNLMRDYKSIRVKWTRAHAGTEENEFCDALAKAACRNPEGLLNAGVFAGVEIERVPR